MSDFSPKEQELIDMGLLTKADQSLLRTRPEVAKAANDILKGLKPRTLGITMTTKEETDLREYLELTTQEDKEQGLATPPIVSDLLEALIQGEGKKEFSYEGSKI
jgi:hypothetical protein